MPLFRILPRGRAVCRRQTARSLVDAGEHWFPFLITAWERPSVTQQAKAASNPGCLGPCPLIGKSSKGGTSSGLAGGGMLVAARLAAAVAGPLQSTACHSSCSPYD